mmetsp:Transcript_19935/g.40557  ORF Transcript_19935/g.40557 Transcript_19935/m.40557 type:complete len:862 (-) Transcript_19935:3760-6345(-)
MRSSGNVAGLQPPSSPGGRNTTSGSAGPPPPVSPRFSPTPAAHMHRPPISPGGGRHSSSTSMLQMPPLSPGGGHRTRSNSTSGLVSGTTTTTPSSRRNEVLNRAHRRVASGGALGSINLSGSAFGGGGSSSGARPVVRGLSVPRSSSNHGATSHRKHQHLPMRMSMSVDEYDSTAGAGAGSGIVPFPSSPHRPPPSAGHQSSSRSPYIATTGSSTNRLRSVSYDEADTHTKNSSSSSGDMPQDELDAIRLELKNRRERQALLDQRRRELEEIMSSTPPTRRVVTTTGTGAGAHSNSRSASGGGDDGARMADDGVSPLKTSDSPVRDKRLMLDQQRRRQKQQRELRRKQQQQEGGEVGESSDNANANGVGAGADGGVGGSSNDEDGPTVVSASSPSLDCGEEASLSDNSSKDSGGGGGTGRPSIHGGGGRRGRSLTPRVRGGGSLLQQQHPPTSRRLMSHSPAPQNVGVRRLGRAVDAVLARRKRRGSLSSGIDGSAGGGGGSSRGPSSSSLDPSEPYQQSLTDEEKHVLAKIIVAVDTKLEKELDLVKSDLQDKTKREARVQEELKKEKDKVGLLERELEKARGGSGANGGVTLKHTEASQKAMDDRCNEMEKEHEMSIRAVQRVLADVTTDKDNKIEELQQKLKELAAANESLSEKLNSSDKVDGGTRAGGTAAAADADADATTSEARDAVLMKRDETIQSLEKKVETLVEEKDKIEAELTTSKTIAAASMSSKELEVSKRDETITALEEQLATVTSEKESLQVGLKDAGSSIPPQPAATTSSSEEGLEQLRAENIKLKKDLSDKISSLETAKMMITSLESASGAQANDLRAKLKERNVSTRRALKPLSSTNWSVCYCVL